MGSDRDKAVGRKYARLVEVEINAANAAPSEYENTGHYMSF